MVTGAPEVARMQLSKAHVELPVLAKPLDADIPTRMAEQLCAARAA